jgi:hypothetical protein
MKVTLKVENPPNPHLTSQKQYSRQIRKLEELSYGKR